MKKISLICSVVLLLFSCKDKPKDENNEIAEVKQYTIEQFMSNKKASANGFSSDDSKVLVTSNRSGIYNMYNVAAEGGELKPITQSDSASIYGISYFPDDDRILFRMDGNGDEIFKIFVKDSSGIKRLTPEKNVRALFQGWAKDGKSFYYSSNERSPQAMDIYEMDIATFKPKLIYNNTENMDFGDISEDKNYILVTKEINTNDNDLYLLNTKTNQKTKINDTLSKNSPQDFSPDGKSFYYTTDNNSEFSYLMKYNIEDGSKEKVVEKDWDISAFYFTHNGKYQIMFSNEDAKTKMYVNETASGKELNFPDIDGQAIESASFSNDETMALLTVGSSQ